MLDREWNRTWFMTPVCYLNYWITFFVGMSQMYTKRSSHEAMFLAIGEN